jgi:two-component system sensor histidine kinase HydH
MPAQTRPLRIHEILLALIFITMAVLDPDHDPREWTLVILLGIMQLAEFRLPILESTQGRVAWIVLKLAMGYLLIGYSDGLTSHYYLVVLLPVISAASYLNALGTLALSLLATASYSTFLLFVDWKHVEFDPQNQRIFIIRLLFILLIGQLVNMLGEAVRTQSAKYKTTAEQLAQANQQLREAEAAVRRSERLAALGQLTAGLAHELRNPLGTIKASSEMLSRNIAGENEIAREVAGYISTEVDRCNSLVSRFLDFARPLEARLAPVELSQVIDRAIDMAQRDAGAQNITIYRNYAPDIPPFPMDAELMERVFFNVIQNAVQASPPGSSITVKTRAAGDTAETCVIDRGSGIDPKIAETIFNPFFTTKSNGVGLGLAIVSKIIDRHGGKMTVESQPGEGSVFHILLPLRPEPSNS